MCAQIELSGRRWVEHDRQAVAMITDPISMFLRSALYRRTALADLKKIQRLTPALQNEIAANVAAFINLASVSSNEAFLYDFLATATQQRLAATAAGATSIADARLATAALSESWCGAKLAAGKRQISVSAATEITQAIEQFCARASTPQ